MYFSRLFVDFFLGCFRRHQEWKGDALGNDQWLDRCGFFVKKVGCHVGNLHLHTKRGVNYMFSLVQRMIFSPTKVPGDWSPYHEVFHISIFADLNVISSR